MLTVFTQRNGTEKTLGCPLSRALSILYVPSLHTVCSLLSAAGCVTAFAVCGAQLACYARVCMCVFVCEPAWQLRCVTNAGLLLYASGGLRVVRGTVGKKNTRTSDKCTCRTTPHTPLLAGRDGRRVLCFVFAIQKGKVVRFVWQTNRHWNGGLYPRSKQQSGFMRNVTRKGLPIVFQ